MSGDHLLRYVITSPFYSRALLLLVLVSLGASYFCLGQVAIWH